MKKKYINKIQTDKSFKLRRAKLIVIELITVTVFIGLIFRIIQINSVYGDQAERIVTQMQITSKSNASRILPERGAIYDRNMRNLAASYSVYNIILDIRDLVKTNEKTVTNTITTLSEYLNIPLDTLQEAVKLDDTGLKAINDTHYFIIARNVPIKTVNELRKTNIGYYFTEEIQKRTYPHNNLAAQVIGFIRQSDSYGLENQYNKDMTGTQGRIFNALMRRNEVQENRIDAQNGFSIVSTLDLNIQQFAEKAIEKAVNDYKPENASVIAMNPHTGEILAMAQYPSFNPNEPSNFDYIKNIGLNDDEDITPEDNLNILFNTWTNFNISRSFEPGSIFKPLVVAAALDEGVITPNDTFFCSGSIEVNGHKIRCWHKEGHGHQTVSEALANSCNPALIQIGQKLGKERFYKYQREFGYGERTGIDIPNEISASNFLYSVNQLNPLELATSSIGQGFNSTAIQAITSFSSIINGGNLMKPFVASQIIDSNGNVIKENRPEVVRKVISASTSDFLRVELSNVFTASGTGWRAEIPGYSIGGKTGTAEQGDRGASLYTLSFIGYLPVENPEVIVMVVLHLPEYLEGYTTPSYMMREMLVNIINYKNIQPTYQQQPGEIRNINNEPTIVLDDFVGKNLSYALGKLNSLGIDFDIISNGNIVTSQEPAGGTAIPLSHKVYFKIEHDESLSELVLVPDILNAEVSQAADILTSAGLSVFVIDENNQNIENFNQQSEQELIVIDQLPRADTRVESGTQIRLKVTNDSKNS